MVVLFVLIRVSGRHRVAQGYKRLKSINLMENSSGMCGITRSTRRLRNPKAVPIRRRTRGQRGSVCAGETTATSARSVISGACRVEMSGGQGECFDFVPTRSTEPPGESSQANKGLFARNFDAEEICQ